MPAAIAVRLVGAIRVDVARTATVADTGAQHQARHPTREGKSMLDGYETYTEEVGEVLKRAFEINYGDCIEEARSKFNHIYDSTTK